jgi:hypothetical protein
MATVRPLCAFLPCMGPHVSADASPRSPRVGNTGAGQRRDGGGLLCRHSLAPAQQVCRVRRVALSGAGRNGHRRARLRCLHNHWRKCRAAPAGQVTHPPPRHSISAPPEQLLRRQAAARLNITQRSISRAIIEFASINTSRMPATSCSVTPVSWAVRASCPSVQAPRLALSFRPHPRLAQVQEPGCAGGEARDRKGLGVMSERRLKAWMRRAFVHLDRRHRVAHQRSASVASCLSSPPLFAVRDSS